jgi:histidinol-phosphatase (PHP family)
MLENPYFEFICHPDIVKKTGIAIPAECSPLVDSVLSMAAGKNIAMEFNTGGWDHQANDSYPSVDFVRKCVIKNIPFTIGSDAHSPDRVGMYYERAVDILTRAGYKTVLTFENRAGKPVPL